MNWGVRACVYETTHPKMANPSTRLQSWKSTLANTPNVYFNVDFVIFVALFIIILLLCYAFLAICTYRHGKLTVVLNICIICQAKQTMHGQKIENGNHSGQNWLKNCKIYLNCNIQKKETGFLLLIFSLSTFYSREINDLLEFTFDFPQVNSEDTLLLNFLIIITNSYSYVSDNFCYAYNLRICSVAKNSRNEIPTWVSNL